MDWLLDLAESYIGEYGFSMKKESIDEFCVEYATAYAAYLDAGGEPYSYGDKLAKAGKNVKR